MVSTSRKASRRALITTHFPELNQILGDSLDQRGIDFVVTEIGPYTIFHGLSEPIHPDQLGCVSMSFRRLVPSGRDAGHLHDGHAFFDWTGHILAPASRGLDALRRDHFEGGPIFAHAAGQ